MDELGFLAAPGARMGYLDAQLMRAIRVIIDIGMHLELPVAPDWAPGAGQRWTPELALEFFVAHSGREPRLPGQRDRPLPERARPGDQLQAGGAGLAGRAGRRPRRAAGRGDSFDLKAWHMAALSLGSLGLDDLAEELAAAASPDEYGWLLAMAGRSVPRLRRSSRTRCRAAGLAVVDHRAGGRTGEQRRERQRALACLGQEPPLAACGAAASPWRGPGRRW